MLNRAARFVLVATALSPVLGAVAINQISLGRPWQGWLPWIVATIALTLMCWLMLALVTKHGQTQRITIKTFDRQDKEALGFLLAYLLPFLTSEDMAFAGEWITGVYVITLLLIVFAHAGAIHFNPLMGLLGYHFYAIRDGEDGPKLLITRAELQRPGEVVRVAMLAPCICVHLQGKE